MNLRRELYREQSETAYRARILALEAEVAHRRLEARVWLAFAVAFAVLLALGA